MPRAAFHAVRAIVREGFNRDRIESPPPIFLILFQPATSPHSPYRKTRFMSARSGEDSMSFAVAC